MCIQSVGELKDYYKYGLLRTLAYSGFKLGIQTYNTNDDFRKEIYNGPSTRYLGNPQKYKACDPELFETLKVLLRQQNEPDSFLERVTKSHLFPSYTVFFKDLLSFQDIPLEYRDHHRLGWFAYSLNQLQHCDLVFLNPLYGLEIKSVNPYREVTGPYYATLHEVKAILNRHQSVMVYQKVARRSVSDVIADCIERIKNAMGYRGSIHSIQFKTRGSHLFFIVPAPQHNLLIEKALIAYQASPWNTFAKVGEHSN